MRDTPKSQSAQYLRASMYEVLGIAPTASDEEVHAAYRRVVKRAHPDAGGSQRAFLRVNAAYRVLSDPGMRRAHDLWLAHLLDAYDQPGRSGGARPSDGRGAPGGRYTTGGRHAAGGRPGSSGRPGSDGRTDPSGRTDPGRAGTSRHWEAPEHQQGAPATSTPGAPDAGTRGPDDFGPDSFGPNSFGPQAFGSHGFEPRDFGPSGPGTGGQGDLDEPGSHRPGGGRRRSRRRSGATDPLADGPGPAGQAGEPGLTGQPGMWAAWSDDDTIAWGAQRRTRRRYLVSMALCLALFVLAGAVVRLYSIPVALGMTAAAMLIPPLAVFAVNTSRRR